VVIRWLADSASGDSTPPLIQIGTVLVGLIGALSGVLLNKRNNDDERLRRFETMARDLQADVLTLEGYIFSLRSMAASQGINTPAPPELRARRDTS
jgi:hypothetical protein